MRERERVVRERQREREGRVNEREFHCEIKGYDAGRSRKKGFQIVDSKIVFKPIK